MTVIAACAGAANDPANSAANMEIPNLNRVLIFPTLHRSDSDHAPYHSNRRPATLCAQATGTEWWRSGAYHGKAPISRIWPEDVHDHAQRGLEALDAGF